MGRVESLERFSGLRNAGIFNPRRWLESFSIYFAKGHFAAEELEGTASEATAEIVAGTAIAKRSFPTVPSQE